MTSRVARLSPLHLALSEFASSSAKARELEAPVAGGFFFGEIPCGWVLQGIVGVNQRGRSAVRVENEFDGDPTRPRAR